MNNYRPVIGLEIHVELKTESKMFCGCPANWFGKEPNSNTCPVCLGLPGVLPVANQKAIDMVIFLSKALNCKINTVSKFDRKHYFYPDLPKSFQISQYDEPFGINGQYTILDPKIKRETVRIRRVHLEEDTGKLIHKGKNTFIDYNRSGVPLVEIVTEPDFADSHSVKSFLEELQMLIRSLKIADANMEEGLMRLEPNISLKVVGAHELPSYKVEVKNINSFRFAKNAIDYEIKRQTEIINKGETPPQETRGYNEARGVTLSQRSKEDSHDYRYFPEPDIPPIILNVRNNDKLTQVAEETSIELFKKFVIQYSISRETAYILIKDPKKSHLVKQLIKSEKIMSLGNETSKKIVDLVINKKISLTDSFEKIEKDVVDILSPRQTDQVALLAAIEKIIAQNQQAVFDYRGGKQTVIMFLVGQVMKEMMGRADAQIIKTKIIEKLSSQT